MSTKEVTIHDVLDFINDPNLDAIDRRRIITALNEQVKSKRREAKRGLYVGQRVTFFSNSAYRNVAAVIDKVNRVNIDLTEEGTGVKWRVSPQLIKPAG